MGNPSKPQGDKGLRFQWYDKTYTSAGRQIGAWMDQYGRIFEYRQVKQFYPNGKRKGKDKGDWVPTGECGVANH